MELYISDHPLDCLTCGANGDCELQDMAGAVGLRQVRYGYEGENHFDAIKDQSNRTSISTVQVHRRSLCAGLRRDQGTFALTIEGRGFALRCRRVRASPSWTQSACPAAPACRACPTATLQERSVIELEHAVALGDHDRAYCGVVFVQGRTTRRRVGSSRCHKDGGANGATHV
jgi:formate dehydrogenase major subunit